MIDVLFWDYFGILLNVRFAHYVVIKPTVLPLRYSLYSASRRYQTYGSTASLLPCVAFGSLMSEFLHWIVRIEISENVVVVRK
jgi:hypothetical protein